MMDIRVSGVWWGLSCLVYLFERANSKHLGGKLGESPWALASFKFSRKNIDRKGSQVRRQVNKFVDPIPQPHRRSHSFIGLHKARAIAGV